MQTPRAKAPFVPLAADVAFVADFPQAKRGQGAPGRLAAAVDWARA
jgi:hypothetical protein